MVDEGEQKALTILVQRFQAGDSSAFDELVDCLKGRVYGLAMKLVGDHNTADDIAQETFVRVYRNLATLSDISRVVGWVFRIVSNLSKDYYRSKTRDKNLASGWKDAQGLKHKDDMDSDDKEHLRKSLASAMEELSDKHREVFSLHVVDEFSHQEIAKMLNIPEGTAWSRLNYARASLREKLLRVL